MRPRRRLSLVGILAACLAALLPSAARAAAKPGAEFTEAVRRPFTGDYEEMSKRRMLRILVVPSQTHPPRWSARSSSS